MNSAGMLSKRAVCNILLKHTREEGAGLISGSLEDSCKGPSWSPKRQGQGPIPLWLFENLPFAFGRQHPTGKQCRVFNAGASTCYCHQVPGRKKEKSSSGGEGCNYNGNNGTEWLYCLIGEQKTPFVFLELNYCSEMIKYKSEIKKITKAKSSSSEGE